MGLSSITFGGVSSLTKHIVIEEPPEYHFPAKDYESVHIPGRSGDLVMDSGSYQNVSREYKIAIADKSQEYNESKESFLNLVQGLSAWLHKSSGYQRLEDSYDPDVYRLAYYKDEGNVENILGKAGRCTIAFDCKPQRFLKSGEQGVAFTNLSSMAIENPTFFDALPLITITGSGTARLTITNAGQSGNICDMTITNVDGSVSIDSDTQNVFKGVISMNPNVTFAAGLGFPVLKAGTNTMVLTAVSGSFSGLEVVPRWWTL